MQTTTVVVGAGHAGLAVSHCLAARGIDHVVIERGEVAHSWRTERWDSLRLLTPNWQTRVPGLAYDGDDPDGFMTMAEVVAFIERYARLVDPALETGTTVEALTSNGDGYEVVTDRGVLAVPGGGDRFRRIQRAEDSARRGGVSGRHRIRDPDGLHAALGPAR